MMPLLYASVDQKLIVVDIQGGKRIRSRLCSMGILPGKEIKIIKTAHHDSTIISVDQSRYAIGKGIAMKIFVKSKEE